MGKPPTEPEELRREIEQTRAELGETVEALGGKVWAEFLPNGSVFAFAVPCRRSDDKRVLSGQ